MFLESMGELPDMPAFSLRTDLAERRATRNALSSAGLTLDLAYPFTLAPRTVVNNFEPLLEAAAWVGAKLANVLVYDTDPARRLDNLCRLGELAANYSIGLSIEFYPASRLRTFAEATALIDQVQRTDIGLTLDLLHLMRSGERTDVRDERVRIAQICDGPATLEPELREWEASHERLLPGDGAFDIADFMASLPANCPLTLEVPRHKSLHAGMSALERAEQAYRAMRKSLGATLVGNFEKIAEPQAHD